MVTGIDPCTDNISAARRHAQEDKELVGLTYICTSLEEHSLTMTNKYDAVVASEVIEHVDCCPGKFSHPRDLSTREMAEQCRILPLAVVRVLHRSKKKPCLRNLTELLLSVRPRAI